MHFKTNLLTAAILLAPAVISTGTKFNGAWITYCDYALEKPAGGNCKNLTIPAEPDVSGIEKCRLIGRSNGGSIAQMVYKDPKDKQIGCEFYSDKDCTKAVVNPNWDGFDDVLLNLAAVKDAVNYADVQAIKCETV